LVSTSQWVRCSNNILLRWETAGDAGSGIGVGGQAARAAGSPIGIADRRLSYVHRSPLTGLWRKSGKMSWNLRYGQGVLATQNSPARWKASRRKEQLSGDVYHPWWALHNAAGPTLPSRSQRLRVPSSASQSRTWSAVASMPHIPGSHYKGGNLSPSLCPQILPQLSRNRQSLA
jgi:hypothetical protein